ncbi:GNAT family N-acetyltransferase [Candidatus Microgenomates bacterium]|nr:MAG: GNAT family N-acetyltransferase [Candidatus Microgenomates bacterium]
MITKLNFSPQTQQFWQTLTETQKLAPFQTYEWHRNWQKVFISEYDELLILTNQKVIAPLMRNNSTVFFAGGMEISDYMDFIGDGKSVEEFILELLPYLKEKQMSNVILNNIPQDSRVLNFFRNQSSAKIKQEDTTPMVDLPNDWETYVSSLERKARHELRRKLRKFEAQYTEIKVEQSKNLEKDIVVLIELMRLNPDKNVFFTPTMRHFFQTLPSTFPDALTLHVLTIQKQPAAAVLCFENQDEVFLYNSGFDEVRFSGSGFYVKAMHIKQSIEKGKKRYNFLQGSERYKYELGGKDFLVYNITVGL